jgi:hypothetical protein
MLFPASFLVAALPLLVDARISHTSRNHRSIARQFNPRKNYTLDIKYEGENFFTEWNFFTEKDPTQGLVNYLSKKEATYHGLATVQDDNSTIFAVDSTNDLPLNTKRNSIRISTKKTFNSGLFIADFTSMPYGCATWPAYWSVGPNWPKSGEIDIIEGINEQATNQYTLHSVDEGCALQDLTAELQEFTGHVIHEKCASTASDNSGCAFMDQDEASYGKGFNAIGGGVFAHLWDSNGIQFWHFNRTAIPEDITAGIPDPSSWGLPKGFLASTHCNIADYFYEHVLTLDTTLCGSYAGAAYKDQGCPGTCEERVMTGSNFASAKWGVNYIAVYQ